MWNRRARLSSGTFAPPKRGGRRRRLFHGETNELVIQPQAEQHFSHIARVGYQTKVSAADVGARIAEIWTVERIEHLPTELEPDLLL